MVHIVIHCYVKLVNCELVFDYTVDGVWRMNRRSKGYRSTVGSQNVKTVDGSDHIQRESSKGLLPITLSTMV
jgi:hypothetical protein